MMRQERFAFVMILLALVGGLLVTAATSGCDSKQPVVKQVVR